MDKFWNQNNDYVATDRVQIWLNVPYDERQAAKAKGAKWDVVKCRWYAPHGVDIMQLRKWWTPQLKQEYRSMASKGKSRKPRVRRPRSPRPPYQQ